LAIWAFLLVEAAMILFRIIIKIAECIANSRYSKRIRESFKNKSLILTEGNESTSMSRPSKPSKIKKNRVLPKDGKPKNTQSGSDSTSLLQPRLAHFDNSVIIQPVAQVELPTTANTPVVHSLQRPISRNRILPSKNSSKITIR